MSSSEVRDFCLFLKFLSPLPAPGNAQHRVIIEWIDFLIITLCDLGSQLPFKNFCKSTSYRHRKYKWVVDQEPCMCRYENKFWKFKIVSDLYISFKTSDAHFFKWHTKNLKRIRYRKPLGTFSFGEDVFLNYAFMS